MTNKNSNWDYNPEGNKIDRVCRRLLCKELINEKIVGTLDVGDNSLFFKPDIDLLLVNKYYKLSSLEIKGDAHTEDRFGVRRVYLEYISNDNKFLSSNGNEGRGNVLECRAEFFCFYFIKTDEYLIMQTKKLQEWLTINQGKYQVKTAPTRGRNGEILYSSYGIIVPTGVLINEIHAELITSKYKYKDFEEAYLKELKEKSMESN